LEFGFVSSFDLPATCVLVLCSSNCFAVACPVSLTGIG
jgi:hypothetical protein